MWPMYGYILILIWSHGVTLYGSYRKEIKFHNKFDIEDAVNM